MSLAKAVSTSSKESTEFSSAPVPAATIPSKESTESSKASTSAPVDAISLTKAVETAAILEALFEINVAF